MPIAWVFVRDRTGTHRMLDEAALANMLGPAGTLTRVDAGLGTPGWIGTWTKTGG